MKTVRHPYVAIRSPHGGTLVVREQTRHFPGQDNKVPLGWIWKGGVYSNLDNIIEDHGKEVRGEITFQARTKRFAGSRLKRA